MNESSIRADSSETRRTGGLSKKQIVIGLAVGLAAITGYGCNGDDTPAATVSSVDSRSRTTTQVEHRTSASSKTDTCIAVALDNGYKSGRCAYSFLETCTTSSSRDEVARQLKADKAIGFHTFNDCPNMPSTYEDTFKAAYRKRDAW